MLTIDSLKQTVPSIFATQPSPKVSSKYNFVPTLDILENFDREGWQISSAKQLGKGMFGSHEIRLRNGKLPQVGDTLLEAIITNSHNGLLKFSVTAGLHRLVCSNGLTVPTSVSSSISIKHMSVDLSAVRQITDEFARRLPVIEGSVARMESTIMSEASSMDFVNKASLLRWEGGMMPSAELAQQILEPLRTGDVGNSVWKTFNVVQEKFVRGGLKVPGKTNKLRSMRELKNFQKVNKLNAELWELAESYC